MSNLEEVRTGVDFPEIGVSERNGKIFALVDVGRTA